MSTYRLRYLLLLLMMTMTSLPAPASAVTALMAVQADNPPVMTDPGFPFRMYEVNGTYQWAKNFSSVTATPWSQCPLGTLKLSIIAYNNYTNANLTSNIESGTWIQTKSGTVFTGLLSLWIVLPVTNFNSASFSGLGSLQMLYIRSSTLLTLTPSTVTSLSKLKWLCVDFCNMTNFTAVTTSVSCSSTAALSWSDQCFRYA